MALIYKPCTYPQMKAKCCHDLLYKRSFHSSSQRANWGELNHHIALNKAHPAAPAFQKAAKAVLCARVPVSTLTTHGVEGCSAGSGAAHGCFLGS